MRIDQLNGLMALKAVAETKNFTLAAEKLNVTASAISQTIKQLEQRLGVALLARTTRSTSLTQAGERFLKQAGPALDQVLYAMEDVGAYAKHPSGVLRISLPRHIYAFYLAPIMAGFIKNHPDITLDLTFDDQQSEDLDKAYDARILLSDFLADDIGALKLYGPVRFVAAASPEYLKKAGRPKHPKDLLSHNCISPHCAGESVYNRWEFEHEGKEFQVQVKGSLIINDTLIMLDAAVKGMGVIYTTEEAIKDHVRDGKLEIVLSQYASTSTGFYLYYPNRNQVLPKLRAFIDYLKNAQRLKPAA